MPEVTVVIPTRDRWPVLTSSGLRSALMQEDVDLEIVVVDDGSSDETPAQLAAVDDARVRVLRHEASRGVASARNTGIAAAHGEWIAFLDDDDLWSPRKLRTQLDVAHASRASLVYAGVVVLDANRNVLHSTQPVGATLEGLLERNTIPAGSSNVVASLAHVRAVDGFDERLTYVADWDIWIKLAATGSIAVVPELLVGYVRHGNGMTFTGRDAIREMRYFVQKHREHGLRADPSRFLSWVATEDRLAGRRRDAASTYIRSALAFRKPGHVLHAAASLLDTQGKGSLRRRSAGRPQPLASVSLTDVPWLERYR